MMPAQYEAIRDRLVAKGMEYDLSQSRAAAIYNAKHRNLPMSGAHPEGAAKKKAARRHALLSQMKGH